MSISENSGDKVVVKLKETSFYSHCIKLVLYVTALSLDHQILNNDTETFYNYERVALA